MQNLKWRTLGSALAAVLLAIGAGACGDDGSGPDDDHGDEVEGVVLRLNAQDIATYDGDSGTWTGEMEVMAGEETAHIDVIFVDHDGDPITLDADFYLMVEVEDESIAEFEQDVPGEFGGHLHGVAAGETDVVFSLMHGAVGSGHADFVTTAVHAHVEAP